MSGVILSLPLSLSANRLRTLYAKRLLGRQAEEPIRVFLRKSSNNWDLLKNKKGWSVDPSLYHAQVDQLVRKKYDTVEPRYYSRSDDYIVVIPTPVGNVVLTIELTDSNKPTKLRTHNVAIALPESLLPYIGHEFDDIDEFLGVIHYRPDNNDDDSLYRQVEEIIYRDIVSRATWTIAIGVLLLGMFSITTGI